MKSSESFQGKCPKCGRYAIEKCPNCNEDVEGAKSGLYHPLLSFAQALRTSDRKLGPLEITSLLAIASHHSPLWSGKYGKFSEIGLPNYVFADELDRFLENEYRKRTGLEKLFHLDDIPAGSPSKILGRLLSKLSGLPVDELRELRIAYAYLKTLLHYCDWSAAKHKSPRISAPDVRDKVYNLFAEKGWSLNEFQRILSKHSGNAILQAPCGSGKTEAAVLWASNNLKHHKIMYFLPTITTTNKIFDRMKIFYEDDVDILHSYASYIRESEEGGELEEHELKSFMSPVTVATVDQFLLSLFNWKRWDTALGNAMNSLIIIDEVHCYEPYTLGLIYTSFRGLGDFPTRFLVMSATLPKAVEDRIGEAIGKRKTFRYPGSKDPRVDIKPRLDEEIEGSTDEMIRDASKGLRVLVVVNTVRKSKELYNELKDFGNVLLFHGEFNIQDRRKKEDELSDPSRGFIAITTQTVEVSLDLDFDVLYTELAPPDALVQRMGRVNRKGERDPADVFVYKAGMGSKKVYSVADGRILDLSKDVPSGPLSNRDLSSWIIDSYDVDWYQEHLGKGICYAREIRERLCFDRCRGLYSILIESDKLLGSLTRDTQYPTVNAVPEYHETEDIDLLSEISRADRTELLDLVKRYSVRTYHGEAERKDRFWIIRKSYSSDYGLKKS